MSITAIYGGRGDSIVGSSDKEITSAKIFIGNEALPTRDGTVTNLGAVATAQVYTGGTGASKRILADAGGNFNAVSSGDWVEIDTVGPRKVIAKISSTEIEVDTDVPQILQASAVDMFLYSTTLTGSGTDFTVLQVGDYIQVGDYDSLQICEVITVTSATSITVRFGQDDAEDIDRKILASTASAWRIFDLTFLGDCAKVTISQNPTQKDLSGMLSGPKGSTVITSDEMTVVIEALETSLQRLRKIDRSISLYRNGSGTIVGARGASLKGTKARDNHVPVLIVEVEDGNEATDKLRWLRIFKTFFVPNKSWEIDGDTQRKITLNGVAYVDRTKQDPEGRSCYWETGEIPA